MTSDTSPEDQSPPRLLVFSRTTGFRHESIEVGVAAITDIANGSGFEVVATEDPGEFTDDGLAGFEAVVFLSTTGDVLAGEQQDAFERFVSGGGGFIGVHSAADTEYEWPWYGELVGAWFDRHPQVQAATVTVEEADHPVMSGIEETFERTDEWYDFRTLPADGVTVLATLDETTYEGGGMGDPHPIMWAHELLGGRSVYTGFGHTAESFDEPIVRQLIGNAIDWVMAGS